jgi:hypothetical protein
MLKLNKEYQLNVSDKIKTKIGTTNRNEPKVVYVHGGTWVTPTQCEEYDKIIDAIGKSFRHNVKRMVTNDYLFNPRHILDFNLSTTAMDIGKKSFLSFDLFLKQEGDVPLKELKVMITGNIRALLLDLEEDFTNNGFILFAKKNEEK